MKGLFLSIFLMMAPVAALHAAPAATNLYEIEVVVFENRLSGLEGGELWAREREKPASTGKDKPVSAGETSPANSSLSATAAALENSGRHHVLAHLRWRQSAEAKSVSKPVKISNTAGATGWLAAVLSEPLSDRGDESGLARNARRRSIQRGSGKRCCGVSPERAPAHQGIGDPLLRPPEIRRTGAGFARQGRCSALNDQGNHLFQQ